MNRFLKNGLLIISCFAIFNMANSATYTTGGGKKKEATQRNTILGSKLKGYFPLSFNSGYRFKGSLNFTTTGTNSMVMHHNVMRYEKGNTMYVLPYRQRTLHPKIKLGVHPQ